MTVKKQKAAASPDDTPQPEERGRELVRRAPISARRRTSLGSPSSRDRANAPSSRDPSPSPTLSRSKRGRQPTRDAETLKEASVSDEEDLKALEESIAPAVVSSPKRPKKLEEAAEEGPAADEEEESSSASEELKRSKPRAKPQNKPKLSLKPMKRSKSEDDLQESGGNTDSQKKQTFVPLQPKPSDALRLKAPSSKRSDGAQPQKTKKVTYRGFGKPGEPAPPDRRKTAAALQDARTKRIRIVQFGGGTGSNAGDAALTSFLGSRRRAATDLGGGVAQSGALTSEASIIKAADPADSDHSEADTASESEAAESTPAVAKAEQESEELLVLSEEEEANTNAPATANNNKSKQLVIITHWHEDHAGDPKTLWQSEPKTENIATILGSEGAADTDPKPRLIYGQREPTKDYAGLANTLPRKQVTTNGEKLFAWKTKPGKVKKGVPQAGELRVEGRAIRPPDVTLKMKMDKKKKEIKPDVQNTESLGVLTIVDKYGDAKEGAAREKERLFTMVSLGDMDGVKKAEKEQVAQLVTAVKDRYGQGFPIDVVKISHHGSDTNLPVVPAGLISNETTVVISGYTGKASGPLIKAIKGWKAKSVIVLVQNNATITKLSEMGADWKNLEPHVIVANNLVMTVDDDGSVNIEATTF